MYYSELVLKASQIMFEAHKNDVDKGGYPYVFHPYHLASQMDDEESVCVALLHDVIEDHPDLYSFENLHNIGFNDRILEALQVLTHCENASYMDYIKKISENPIARKVKIADLKHNLDIRRVGNAKPKKYDTYIEALNFLNSN